MQRMRPIDIVRANGLTLTSLGTSRVAAYGHVKDVGIVELNESADREVRDGDFLKIGEDRFAFVKPDASLAEACDANFDEFEVRKARYKTCFAWGQGEPNPITDRTSEESQKLWVSIQKCLVAYDKEMRPAGKRLVADLAAHERKNPDDASS